MDEDQDRIASAIEHNAIATEHSTKVQERKMRKDDTRFRWLAVAVVMVFIINAGGLLGIFFYFKGRADLEAAQDRCAEILYNDYISKIGALAITNGASLRPGNTPEQIAALSERGRQIVADMEKTLVLQRDIESVCYDDNPDLTPLDGTKDR